MLQKIDLNHYVDALIAITIEEDSFENHIKSARLVLDAFESNSQYFNLLISPTFTMEMKKKFLNDAFGKKIGKNFYNFLYLLLDAHLIRKIVFLMRLFLKHAYKILQLYPGIIFSTIKLDELQIKKITQKISTLTKRKIILKNEIDPNLIAGIRVVIDDQIFDNSINKQLDALKNNLLLQKNAMETKLEKKGE